MSDDPRKEAYYDPALTSALATVKSQAAELAALRAEMDAGHAFYKLTVAQRDAAWAEVERLRKDVGRLQAAITWALGEGDSNFGDNMPPKYAPYWWRKELRERAALAAESKRQPEGSQVAPDADCPSCGSPTGICTYSCRAALPPKEGG